MNSVPGKGSIVLKRSFFSWHELQNESGFRFNTKGGGGFSRLLPSRNLCAVARTGEADYTSFPKAARPPLTALLKKDRKTTE